MNGKAPLLLGLAAACGLASMVGVRSLLKRQANSEVPMSEVLIAAQDIQVEQTISDEMVTSKSLPSEMVPPGALTDVKQARGRWATIRILPGDVILNGKLAEKGTPTGLIARISPGMRAFAVRVDEQSGVSGFILPDYRVDVLQALPDQPGQAKVILENVRVLASGSVIESPEGRSIEAKTVTLEVTPDQVRVLASAMQEGPLTLTLRGLNDHTMVAAAEPEPEPEPEPTMVEVEEPDPEPEPEPEPAPPPPPALVSEEPESDVASKHLPRRLTVFAGGRTQPWMIVITPKPESKTPEPSSVDQSETRRSFRLDDLDGIGAAIGIDAVPSSPSG